MISCDVISRQLYGITSFHYKVRTMAFPDSKYIPHNEMLDVHILLISDLIVYEVLREWTSIIISNLVGITTHTN